MDVFLNKESCSGCTACEHICPVNCISMAADEKGFSYPQIHMPACTNCGLCRTVCPFRKDTWEGKLFFPAPKIYAVKHKDEPVRAASSSGGAFTAVSDWFLKNNGIVYGAAFDDNFRVCHIRCENSLERNKLRGSKYVQSELGDIFLKVQADLADGRKVLFSGTPCQTAGLYAYLGTDHENLFCCDLVCHGVPSPKIFKEYLEYVARQNKKKIVGLDFRDKIKGWVKFSFTITFRDKIKSAWILDDPYGFLFLRNIILRPACYSCRFASFTRPADITIGDFWDIGKILPGFSDDKGVSLVLINTGKGESLFDLIKSEIEFKPGSTAACTNQNLFHPTRPSPQLASFWADYAKKGFEYVIFKYTLISPANRVKEKLYALARHKLVSPYLQGLKRVIFKHKK